MKLSCAVPTHKASEGFAGKIAQLGIKPIITSMVIRAVYEGNNHKLCDKLVALFEQEEDHDIVLLGDNVKGSKHTKRR